jgi:hypothetical protein
LLIGGRRGYVRSVSLTVGGSKDTSLKEASDELDSSGVQLIYYRRKANVLNSCWRYTQDTNTAIATIGT